MNIEILLVLILGALVVLILTIYRGVMAMCDEIIATRDKLSGQLKRIQSDIAIGFDDEIEAFSKKSREQLAAFTGPFQTFSAPPCVR